MQPDYGIRTTVEIPFDEAVRRTREALQKQGFGILSEIDIQQKLKEKVGAAMPRYLILGACNPSLAHKALQAEPELGLLLPCNVIVYEKEGGGTVVTAVDPDAMLSVVDNAAVAEIAREAKTRLRTVIDEVATAR